MDTVKENKPDFLTLFLAAVKITHNVDLLELMEEEGLNPYNEWKSIDQMPSLERCKIRLSDGQIAFGHRNNDVIHFHIHKTEIYESRPLSSLDGAMCCEYNG